MGGGFAPQSGIDLQILKSSYVVRSINASVAHLSAWSQKLGFESQHSANIVKAASAAATVSSVASTSAAASAFAVASATTAASAATAASSSSAAAASAAAEAALSQYH